MIFLKNRKKRVIVFACLITLAIGYRFYNTPQHLVFNGQTMGTVYTIKASFPRRISKEPIQEKVDEALNKVNFQFSTYDKTSVISRFNRSQEGITVSNSFLHLYNRAQAIHKHSFGAWDGTIKPLVTLWGFMDPELPSRIPTRTEINQVKEKMGFNLIRLEDHFLRKLSPEILLDFSSIAKGYGVDILGAVLKDFAATDFLVEIGGEVLSYGKAPSGKAWKLGINVPDPGSERTSIYSVVSLTNQALATSGDYRHYFEKDGKRYSHILDPRTGYPVSHPVVSVSVIAPDCTTADGYATALMVMGHEEGVTLVESLSDVEVLFILRDGKGGFRSVKSSGFIDLEL